MGKSEPNISRSSGAGRAREKKEKRLGGAANVALNVQALGATPIPCSIVGDDLDGEFFLKRLNERKIPKAKELLQVPKELLR